jgi:glycosyltransferase involved in cell wall biosynthesis
VIPTRNSVAVLPGCLESLRAQTVPPDEVIVCDGGSTDGTASLAREAGATVLSSAPNRSLQRNRGALRAQSTYVLFVDSDMYLTSRVVEECVRGFGDADAALVVPEVFVGEGFWGRARGFERSFYDDVWWVQAARCFRREEFLSVGGFDTRLVGPEDWDLDQRARSLGSVRPIRAHIEHREGHVRLKALLDKKSLYAGSFMEFRAKHPERAALCLSGTRRVRVLLGKPYKLAEHPVRALGVAVLGISELVIAKLGSGNRGLGAEQPLGPGEAPHGGEPSSAAQCGPVSASEETG